HDNACSSERADQARVLHLPDRGQGLQRGDARRRREGSESVRNLYQVPRLQILPHRAGQGLQGEPRGANERPDQGSAQQGDARDTEALLLRRTMPKILTRLRIDEVSAVDKGAGEGVKVLLMKRADGAQPKNEDRVMSTFLDFFKRKNPASEVLAKAVSALAESVGAIYTSTDDEDSKATALADPFKEFQDHLEQNLTIPAGGSAGD